MGSPLTDQIGVHSALVEASLGLLVEPTTWGATERPRFNATFEVAIRTDGHGTLRIASRLKKAEVLCRDDLGTESLFADD